MPIVRAEEDQKKDLIETFTKETLTPFLKNIETILDKNGGQFLVGQSVSITITFLLPAKNLYQIIFNIKN